MIMERSPDARNGARAAAVGVAALVLGAVTLAGVNLTGERAGAAPNPIGARSSTATVTLAGADGSYRVDLTQQAELLDDTYGLRFDLALHDGFRAPDDDEPGPPPYLRPEYVLEEASFDGESAAADFTREGHLLSLEAGGEVSEGDHQSRFVYTVRGAALPTDGGYEVYVRSGGFPLHASTVVDGSALAGAGITGLRCQVRPIFTPCGEQVDGQRWRLTDQPGEVLVIEVAGDRDRLAEPTIDRE